ncbi:unnamed protein product [Paramecium sonneborni]|uniref:Transketolase-like pyrimidine-binding domain-containing protein n=1 Tax=Paramecium sonneborni TaxID=65129 RepID=A0A8S1KNU1_9CILI|nr:unnamed protein product [Paramecium sonneborni]
MQQKINYARLLRYQFTNYKNYGQLNQVKLDRGLLENIENKQYHYIQYYRQNGHLVAQLDPLGLLESKQKEMPGVLDFGIKYNDDVNVNNILKGTIRSIEELEEYVNKLYAQSVGVEFEQVEDPEEKRWLYENYENNMNEQITQADRVSIHNLLVQMEAIDHYYHKKFTTFKRYAGEGGEGVIVALRAIYGQAADSGVTDIVQSMAHRGRFPIMSSLLDYPASDIFRKIMGENDLPQEYTFGVDDVVHHLSTSNKKKFNNKDLTITVVHNPSHLEAANPVSQGKAKAKQDDYRNINQVLNLQLHGDAAFAGQGIVYESMLLSGLDNYSNGGTVHIIQNNQIGYTTNIKDSRFSRYSSDLLLAYKYPIIHVNGEDVETLHKVSKFAVQYRQMFKKDILIDIVTYRRYGHNEVDEPSFTQPNMYEKVRKTKSLPQKYNQLYFRQEDYDKIRQKVFAYLDSEYEKAKTMKQTLSKVTDDKSKGSKAFTQKWSQMKFSQFCESDAKTGLNKDYLINLAKQSVVIRPNFNLHPRLQKYFIDDRLDQIKNNSIDWATCETIAVGSLLEEGFNVRLSGEDVERGTFSQRHWAFIDQKTEEKWIPMQNFADAKLQGRLQVANSPLAEASVMGYEFGYSLENPNNLVMWEAQFGDFYNTGQHMSDTFITCAEEKWMRQSSLVLLLPHGYDGAGPEHSSCRMERWLQQGVQNQNFQFAIPSNPSSIFHLLRRQMHRQFRKPLIIANAKSLLRSNKAKCTFEDLTENNSFQRIITHKKGHSINKVIFTYGKFVYDLLEQFEKRNADNYVIFTFEQLLPFPKNELEQGLKQISKDAKFYFVQEEPQNQGGFNYCQPFIDQIMTSLQFTSKSINYIGRPECPCVAVGATVLHKQELQNIVKQIDSIL